MGKKGGWISAVKKALTTDSKDKKQTKTHKSKRQSANEKDHQDCPLQSKETPVAPSQDVDKNNSNEVIEHNACSGTFPSAETEDQMVPETAFLKSMARYPGKSMEEIAAIRIQGVFRGFLARREMREFRGLERLKLLVEGQSAKRQSATALKCMQSLARLQSQICARRVRMSEENQSLHRQLQEKHDKEHERLSMGKEWDVSIQSKEEIEEKLQSKQEAAMRRERALAYSFSHQTRKKSRSVNPSFMDPNNPRWGWSWMERWMASRPWDTRTASMMDNKDRASLKSTISQSPSLAKETKQKPKATTIAQVSNAPLKRPKNAKEKETEGSESQPRPNRRHSVGGMTTRDDESLDSSSPVPSYMTATKSTKARSKTASPLKVMDYAGVSGKGPVKKRLSGQPRFPPPGARRHSHPGKIEGSSEKNGASSQG